MDGCGSDGLDCSTAQQVTLFETIKLATRRMVVRGEIRVIPNKARLVHARHLVPI